MILGYAGKKSPSLCTTHHVRISKIFPAKNPNIGGFFAQTTASFCKKLTIIFPLKIVKNRRKL
jgi:hypothetical protein